ncbi:hypothetical protein cyc_09326 [Cyclospora cayetanensis]|uniref:Uncharacterized protein n=1 Tax=Cyclospora cayetanensis TaxID=88456 RepID=A0A1D3D247_9EIME|nr:hypothetical protein cyc_09326 [Cyclospora cayetanensis]
MAALAAAFRREEYELGARERGMGRLSGTCCHPPKADCKLSLTLSGTRLVPPKGVAAAPADSAAADLRRTLFFGLPIRERRQPACCPGALEGTGEVFLSRAGAASACVPSTDKGGPSGGPWGAAAAAASLATGGPPVDSRRKIGRGDLRGARGETQQCMQQLPLASL